MNTAIAVERLPAQQGDRRVLIVDDDRDFADALAELLAFDDYAVKTAYGPTEADAALRAFEPEVALVDVRLGSASGLEQVGRMRAERPELICVMVTAHAEIDAAIEAVRHGAYDFLRKPLRNDEVLALLDRCFEKLRLEREKRAAEGVSSRLGRILDNSSNEIFVLDPATFSFVQANRGARRNLGYTAPELEAMTLADLHPDLDVEGLRRILAPLREATPERLVYENEFRRRDGSVYPVEIGAQLFADEDPPVLVAIAQDITARGEAERELRESGDRLVHTQRIAHLGSFERDLRSDATAWSDETFRIFGLDPDRHRPSFGLFLDRVHPQDREAVERAVTDTLEGRTTGWVDFRVQRHDDERLCHTVSEVVRDDDGTPVLLRGAVHDITEWRRAEEALRESEQRYRRLVEMSPDGVLVRTGEEIVFANETMARLLGADSPAALIGRPGIEIIPPEDRPEVLERRRQADRGHMLGFAERKLLRLDGSTVEVESTAGKISWHGQPSFLVLMRDITQRKQRDEQLRQAQKMEAIGQLTGGIAHDFNNLLTVILGNLQLLESRIEGDADALRLATKSMDASRRAADLTYQLLAFARRQPLQPKLTDLDELIAGTYDMLNRTLGEAIAVEQIRSEGLWDTVADPVQLQNAILNLAINARDAMPRGGTLTLATGNVELDTARINSLGFAGELEPGPYVTLTVGDTGCGMTPEILTRAFDPFFTTKEVGQGSGLGLSMVYGFAKQSGGHAAIDSQPGVATRVTLYLPKAADGAVQAPTCAPLDAVPDGRGAILVVEDQPEVRELVLTHLANWGYRVLQAEDGDEALRILDGKTPIDLLFTDVVLPNGVSGIEIAERARSRHPDIMVLFTSGYTEREDIAREGVLGETAAFLPKPYRAEELGSMLRGLFDARGGLPEAQKKTKERGSK